MSRSLKWLPLGVIAYVSWLGGIAQSQPSAQILDRIQVADHSSDGTKINELSGLAWDTDAKRLYAVSDNGYLHAFSLEIQSDRIAKLESVASSYIADARGGFFSWNLTDAEDLHVENGDNGKPDDAELVIAFEDGPALARFTSTGEFLKEVPLPQPLADTSSYTSSNKRIESVSEVPGIGMITAPEEHLVSEPATEHSIFALDGRSWKFPARESARSSVKALESLSDGRVLVLLRTRNPDTGSQEANLSIVDLAHCRAETLCQVTDVAISSASIAGDFEGMTRVGPDLYVLVTDSPKGGEMLLLRLDASR
jgi:Esterase-like activity of phytase